MHVQRRYGQGHHDHRLSPTLPNPENQLKSCPHCLFHLQSSRDELQTAFAVVTFGFIPQILNKSNLAQVKHLRSFLLSIAADYFSERLSTAQSRRSVCA